LAISVSRESVCSSGRRSRCNIRARDAAQIIIIDLVIGTDRAQLVQARFASPL